MKKHAHLYPYVALLIASLIWGFTVPIMKLTLNEVPVFSLAFLRFGGAALILLPFVLKKLRVKPEHIIIIVISGLLGVTLNITFFFSGLKLTTALNAIILGTTGPLFVLLFAHIFLKETIKRGFIYGAILCLIGILVVSGKQIFLSGFSLSPIGDLFILLAVLSFVAYEIVSKKIMRIYPPITIVFYSLAIGAISFLIPAVLEYQNNPSWVENVSGTAVFGIFYGMFMSSLIAYTLWQWSLSKLQASEVGFFMYIDPVIATIASVMILGEELTLPFIIGASFILSGVILAQGRLPHHPLHHLLHKFHQK